MLGQPFCSGDGKARGFPETAAESPRVAPAAKGAGRGVPLVMWLSLLMKPHWKPGPLNCSANESSQHTESTKRPDRSMTLQVNTVKEEK